MKNAVYPLFASPLMICAEMYEFAAAEERHLSDLEMIDNVGNWMSSDDKVLDNPELERLRRFVDEQLLTYKKHLLRLKDDNEIYLTQSWLNRSDPGQHHPKHNHPNSIISGVLFLDDVSGQAPLRFHRAVELLSLDFEFAELTDFNASCREFDPQRGMLILFPSLLEHDVETNRTDVPRRSLSFNTYVRGQIGGKRQLTRIEMR